MCYDEDKIYSQFPARRAAISWNALFSSGDWDRGAAAAAYPEV